MRTIT